LEDRADTHNLRHIQYTTEYDRNLFFWQFESQHIADRPRLVLWLNGGPGCSSVDGALMEIGPYRVRENGILERNDGSWNEFATLLFVDNPVGTGFSYTGDPNGYVEEVSESAHHLVLFLEKWFALFPEHLHDDVRNFFSLGESCC
jgi:carboxypeptidase D